LAARRNTSTQEKKAQQRRDSAADKPLPSEQQAGEHTASVAVLVRSHDTALRQNGGGPGGGELNVTASRIPLREVPLRLTRLRHGRGPVHVQLHLRKRQQKTRVWLRDGATTLYLRELMNTHCTRWLHSHMRDL
jgi:hypothetical protein